MSAIQINYNGLDIGDGTDFFVTRVDGFYSIPIRTAQDNLTDQDGGVVWAQKYAARVIGITGQVVGDTPADYFDNLTLLSQAYGKVGSALTMTLIKWDEDGTQRRLQCRPLSMPSVIEALGETTFADFRMELIADNPFFLDASTQSLSTGLAEASGIPMSIPMGVPIGSVTSDILTIQNDGNVAAFAEFTITGPVTNPTVTNTTTGKSFTIEDTLTGADTVRVFRDQEGFKVEKNGVDAFATFKGEFFLINTGPNNIRFTSVGFDAGALLQADFTNNYLTW